MIVGGDAAYGSQANMRMVQDRNKADTARRWGFVFAIARTWKTAEDRTIKNLVTHVPQTYYQRTRVPTDQARQHRKTFWTFQTRLCLRHIGEVTVVLSKRGATWAQTDQNPGDQSGRVDVEPSRVHLPKALGNRDPALGAEIGLGLGRAPSRGDQNRSEKSVGIAVLAYLFVLRVCHHEIVPGKPWSIFQLQHTLRLQVMTNQVEHKVKVQMGKTRNAA